MFKYIESEKNEQLKNELKKIMIDNNITQKEVAENMGIKPQQYTNIVKKENLSFKDVNRICSAMGCELMIDIVPRK